MADPISQSDTRWVKVKRNAAGKKIGGGYVEQISTGKKVTGKVKIESVGSTAYNSRGIATYNKGRNTAVAGAKKTSPASPSKPRRSISTGPSVGTSPKPRTQAQSDTGAARTTKTSNMSSSTSTPKPKAKATGAKTSYTTGASALTGTQQKKAQAAGKTWKTAREITKKNDKVASNSKTPSYLAGNKSGDKAPLTKAQQKTQRREGWKQASRAANDVEARAAARRKAAREVESKATGPTGGWGPFRSYKIGDTKGENGSLYRWNGDKFVKVTLVKPKGKK